MELKKFLENTLAAIKEGCDKNNDIEIEFEITLEEGKNNEICLSSSVSYSPKVKFKILVNND